MAADAQLFLIEACDPEGRRYFLKRDTDRMNRSATIADVVKLDLCDFDDELEPVAIYEFNAAEHTISDVSEDLAPEIARDAVQHYEGRLPLRLESFLETYMGVGYFRRVA